MRPDTYRIREASAGDGPAVRILLDEYVRWLGVDLSFQDFDAEYRDWPGKYGPPRGACFVADVGDRRWRQCPCGRWMTRRAR